MQFRGIMDNIKKHFTIVRNLILQAFSLMLGLFFVNPVMAQISDDIDFRGYIQALPIYISAETPEPFPNEFWEYRIQNRLNFRWFASANITFSAEARTRLFAGDLVQDIPGYSDMIDQDDSWINMSWMIIDQDDWFLHFIPDRLFVEWTHNDWNVRAGRQRINWGINTVTNPNDLFNIYSFYDFDYPERPGTDALRIQRYLGISSKVELAFSPATEMTKSVIAALYQFNRNQYDIQIVSGYYKNRFAAGGGWAGSLAQIGFKGEIMYFHDIEETLGEREQNVIVAVSAEHMFDNSIFLIGEVLYNQAGGQSDFSLFNATLSVDNPSFSKFQFTTQVTYTVNPLLQVSMAGIYYPDEEAIFVSPSFTYSLAQNFDFQMLAQIFSGSSNSAFSSAGNTFAASIKWNF